MGIFTEDTSYLGEFAENAEIGYYSEETIYSPEQNIINAYINEQMIFEAALKGDFIELSLNEADETKKNKLKDKFNKSKESGFIKQATTLISNIAEKIAGIFRSVHETISNFITKQAKNLYEKGKGALSDAKLSKIEYTVCSEKPAGFTTLEASLSKVDSLMQSATNGMTNSSDLTQDMLLASLFNKKDLTSKNFKEFAHDLCFNKEEKITGITPNELDTYRDQMITKDDLTRIKKANKASQKSLNNMKKSLIKYAAKTRFKDDSEKLTYHQVGKTTAGEFSVGGSKLDGSATSGKDAATQAYHAVMCVNKIGIVLNKVASAYSREIIFRKKQALKIVAKAIGHGISIKKDKKGEDTTKTNESFMYDGYDYLYEEYSDADVYAEVFAEACEYDAELIFESYSF